MRGRFLDFLHVFPPFNQLRRARLLNVAISLRRAGPFSLLPSLGSPCRRHRMCTFICSRRGMVSTNAPLFHTSFLCKPSWPLHLGAISQSYALPWDRLVTSSLGQSLVPFAGPPCVSIRFTPFLPDLNRGSRLHDRRTLALDFLFGGKLEGHSYGRRNPFLRETSLVQPLSRTHAGLCVCPGLFLA